MHQFEQSPVVIEVKDRNASPDGLIYSVRGHARPCCRAAVQLNGDAFHAQVARELRAAIRSELTAPPHPCRTPRAPPQGPNVIGGYTDPTTGAIVTVEQHSKLVDAELAKESAAGTHGHAHH